MSSVPVVRDKVGSASSSIAHAAKHAAHVSERLDDAGHRIVAMDLIFKIDEALVIGLDERRKHLAEGELALAHSNLAILVVEVSEVFGMHVEEARPNLVNGLNNVGAGSDSVANVDAAAH